ncbi:hypothetical protein Q31b_16820 [Novipirellula aureliae]|uniref:Uncharacterized protein n=1 Tax=Novipirellula aureliae TaxID=2527966 RepID=A0A5C6E9K2_9BACT|nr:hypothetical protein Q31b_16820 [Novipirellula aureliae]
MNHTGERITTTMLQNGFMKVDFPKCFNGRMVFRLLDN